uniref:IS110 family transposase n=1 Tax=Paenibacillus aurantius TaxID=2918900 RepID=UPI0028E668EE|nr:IS110 family transposase [Paenibacillus aurantius]
MNSTQNERITQITSTTLIVGVDIAKFKHVARAKDSRGVEVGKPVTFENTLNGFEHFTHWFRKLMAQQGYTDVIVGMEPTGHYWLNLVHHLKRQDITCGVVNPLHVKRTKELNDNSPTKNDVKDARVIAQLVKDERYAVPSLPQDVYAELREATKIRDHLSTDLRVVQGRMHNLLDRYFPEFLTVFKDWGCKSAIQLIKLKPPPAEIVHVPDEYLNLRETASRSLGIEQGKELAKMELQLLLTQYELLDGVALSRILLSGERHFDDMTLKGMRSNVCI